jgi:allophanate hydrolase
LRSGEAGGASIEGELWALPPAGVASLLAELPAPMAFGRVTLEDGREVIGFLCEPAALADAEEITEHRGWLAYLAARAPEATGPPGPLAGAHAAWTAAIRG